MKGWKLVRIYALDALGCGLGWLSERAHQAAGTPSMATELQAERRVLLEENRIHKVQLKQYRVDTGKMFTIIQRTELRAIRWRYVAKQWRLRAANGGQSTLALARLLENTGSKLLESETAEQTSRDHAVDLATKLRAVTADHDRLSSVCDELRREKSDAIVRAERAERELAEVRASHARCKSRPVFPQRHTLDGLDGEEGM